MATLDIQASLFKFTMQANAQVMMQKPYEINPVIRMWRLIEGNSLLRQQLSKYMKIAEIAIVMVLRSVQDERTFNTLSFMNTKVRNQLTTHFPIVIRMKCRSFYNLFDFPYNKAYESWKEQTNRMCDTT